MAGQGSALCRNDLATSRRPGTSSAQGVQTMATRREGWARLRAISSGKGPSVESFDREVFLGPC